MPAAEFAAIAYVVVAAMLLLALPEAAGVLAYGSTWGVLILAAAPIAEIAPDSAYRAGIGRIAGVVFLILIATFLFAASRVIHLVRRSQQEALAVERRAVKMKDEFVSMVSHEFRTPLTSIAGFVETLKDGWQYLDPAEVDEFLDIIHSEAHHLSNLVEDVLAIPRLEAGRMPIEIEDFELAATVRQVTDRVLPPGGTKDASVAIRGGIVVRADRRRVVQVLRNLLENARKYGGDQVLIEGRPDGEMYLVSISDNGPGVPPDSVERIFDRFEQVSTGDARSDMGIGLGLPIARHLVAAMGGQLWYEPRFPIGSRFCFTLPLVTVAERAVESPESTPAEVA
jgi:signal transduction histidine kinase